MAPTVGCDVEQASVRRAARFSHLILERPELRLLALVLALLLPVLKLLLLLLLLLLGEPDLFDVLEVGRVP